MKKRLHNFTKKIGSGLKQEYQETKDIPKHLKNGDYKIAREQVVDIGKMIFIASIWVLPAGAIVSGALIKFSNKIRPSSFQDSEDEEDTNC